MSKATKYALLLTSFKICGIELWTNKSRSFITSFGIFLGVASLLINISFIRAMDNDLKKNMEEIGGLNIITLKAKTPFDRSELLDFRRSTGLRIDQIEQVAKELPYVKSVLKFQELQLPVFARGKRSYSTTMAVTTDYMRAYNYEVMDGQLLSYEDDLRANPVCIVGTRVLDRLFENEKNPIGQKLTLNGIQLTIRGIIKTDDPFSSKARQILFPYSVYIRRIANKKTVEEIPIELTSTDFITTAVFEFTNRLKALHRGVEDFEFEINADKIEEMKTASMGMKILLVCIAAITLVVGAVSIMNIMFATIGDRIREIGIRKALGARGNDIFFQFLIEAVSLSLVGGIPGMILGGAITAIPDGVFPFKPELILFDYITAVAFTIGSGILSGLAPALRAAGMQPVEALRF